MLADLGIALNVRDERTDGYPLAARFSGSLCATNRRAAEALLEHDMGVLCAPPGSGKTVVGAQLIARRGLSTLVLVHRKPLVEQWIARLREFLDLDPLAIGVIGARPRADGPGRHRDRPSVGSKEFDLTRLGRYGHVVVDECHHVPAVSVERVLGACPARFVTGLTATPYRRDGHHPIIAMQCGPVRHTISRHATAGGLTMRVVRRDTPFDPAVLPPEPGSRRSTPRSPTIRPDSNSSRSTC